jgi:hypothetical protein
MELVHCLVWFGLVGRSVGLVSYACMLACLLACLLARMLDCLEMLINYTVPKLKVIAATSSRKK